ncbi:MAG: fructosamine kinase family protein [Gammaproteobacteria bacterium]|nr:fructosamine kinase family protein [Gammaproteobacteria bacterium]
MSLWEAIGADIAAATGKQGELSGQVSTGGGCINQTMRVRYGDDSYFVKLNSASRTDMFAAEALGLRELQSSHTLKVPEPVCWGDDGESAYLVLEDLELDSHGDLAALGEGLAAMHRVRRERFGWETDNTIGSTLQVNTSDHDWVSFWRTQRLQFQLELAEKNGHGGRLQSQGEKLLDAFPVLFADYSPQASLLHGDLWSGNYAFTREGEPTIYDPAVYYGDREADIAMTELFGGFGPDFYAAYQADYPLDAGYGVRKTLYNLYHILNHLNIFGDGYRSQAQRMMDMLLAELV